MAAPNIHNLPLNPKKKRSKALTRMPHSNLPQNREARAWKHSLSPLSKVTNGRVDYDLLRQEASANGIVWPPPRNVTSPLYRFFLPVGPKIANYYWLQCLYCNSDPMMSKLNLMNRHFFGVGPSSCPRLEPFPAEKQPLFDELKRCYVNGIGQSSTDKFPLIPSLYEEDLVSSSIHTDSEDSGLSNVVPPSTSDVALSTIQEETSHSDFKGKETSLSVSVSALHTFDLKPSPLIRRCYSPQRILKISKLAKRKHRSTYPFAVPGDLKVTTIRKLLVHFGVSVGISTRFVENFWFNKLIRKISPFTPNISASTLEQSTLPQLSAEARESLLLAISKCPYITCECDGWTTMSHNALFCLLITGHKLDSDQQISLLYDQTELKRQMHGAPEICAFLKGAIIKLKAEMAEKASMTEIPKIIGIVADGEPSVRGALTLLCEDTEIGGLLNCRCIAHLCNLMPTSIYKNSPWVRHIVLSTTRIVSYFRCSNRASQELKAAGAERVLQRYCDTRWSSLYYCLASVKSQPDPLVSVIRRRDQLKLAVPNDVVCTINEVGQYLGYWSGLSQLEAIFFYLSITQSLLQTRSLNPADQFVVFWSMCIQMESESRAQGIATFAFSAIRKVLVTRMHEFLFSMPIALIAYLFSPRYRGFLLTCSTGFLKEWEMNIKESWKTVLQYIGVTVDEQMKDEMYIIMETYCVNGFSQDGQHPAFRQLIGHTDTSYWDKVRLWCKNNAGKNITTYFVIACIALRCLLAPGTSSRLESVFSIMKLLSTSTRANMSSDRIVSEFIIRQAQQQIWGEKSDNMRSSRKRAVITSNLHPFEQEDLVDLFSKESHNVEESSSDESVPLDDEHNIGWLPVPCSRTLRNHKRHFGNLPGIWNKVFQEVNEPDDSSNKCNLVFEESNFFS